MLLVWLCLAAAVLLASLWRWLRRRWRRRPSSDEVILVTGCDSGFGFRIVEALLDQTDSSVFAGYISDAGLKRLQALGSRVVPLAMDVTDDGEVNAAFETLARCGKAVRGVVNNAGVGCYAFCEELAMERYEENLRINFLGAVRVTRLALPLLRRSKGRLVTMGSLGGRFPSAFGSAYIPTKAALGSFQDCVRQEVYQFGVRCSLIEPGFFRTGMLHRAASIGEEASSSGASGRQDGHERAYTPFAEKMKRTEKTVSFIEKINGGDHGVGKVTGAVLDALTTVCPQTHYLVGLDANMLGRLGPFVPCWIVDLVQTYVV